jgi:3-isopropylmalate/(R)-2-methylmalate dehydratase small subunit
VAERARLPSMELTVDLPSQRLTLPGGESVTFEIDSFAKKCLQHGLDELGYLLTFEPQIRAHESKHA